MKDLNEGDINSIIEMAWDDHIPFSAIEDQYGIKESEVIKIMRSELKKSSFKMWRKRVSSNLSKKHEKIKPSNQDMRSMQKTISLDKKVEEELGKC